MQRMIQAGVVPVTWQQVLLEWQRDWARKETYDATIAIVGDVALFHDLNGLALAARHGLKLLVVNNGGGAIFGYLAQRQLPEFEQGWLTPPGLNLGAVAEAFGLDYQRIDSGDDPFAVLESALDEMKNVSSGIADCSPPAPNVIPPISAAAIVPARVSAPRT